MQLLNIYDGLVTAFVFLFGLFFGSFLNVVAYRVPRGESIVFPGSHCPSCERQLHAWELVPVLSWLVLRGRCASCKTSIPIRYPLIELVTATWWVSAYWLLPSWPVRVAWFVFILVMMAVVGTDLTSMRVPNVITYPFMVITPILAIVCKVQPWSQSLLGIGVCVGVMILIHLLSRGNMGMGDVKLYFIIGAMLGPVAGVESLVLASFSGSLVGLPMRWTGLLKRREYMPFVPHIAIGVLLAGFFGADITHWYVQTLMGR